MSDRLIQSAALALAAASFTGAALLLPGLDQERRACKMVYEPTGAGNKDATYRLIENLGALRGIAVNVLWNRLDALKNEGRFYEADALGRRIAELQPRLPEVWRYLAYNMAYNISVKCQTQDERWAWIEKALRLLKEEGIPNNPEAQGLYRELAWTYQHKIAGETDDMNRFYKKRLAAHWHLLLGAPPLGRVPKAGSPGQTEDAAVAAMREVAAAARTYCTLRNGTRAAALSPAARAAFLADHPDAAYALKRIQAAYKSAGAKEPDLSPALALDAGRTLAFWEYAQFAAQANLPGLVQTLETKLGPQGLAIFAALVHDARGQTGLLEMLPLLRAMALIESEHMDPVLMLETMEKYGPLDWRHPQSHALFWAYVSAKITAKNNPAGAVASQDDQVTKVNTDRITLAGAQGLMDSGLLFYDPVEDTLSDQPDCRFIASYAKVQDFMRKRAKAGEYAQGDAIVDSLDRGQENFLHRAIQISFLFGEEAAAQDYYRQVKEKFPDSRVYSKYYHLSLPDFVVVTIRQDTLRVVQEGAMYGLLNRGLEAMLLEQNPGLAQVLFKMASDTRDGIEADRADAAKAVAGSDQARQPVPSFEKLTGQALRRFVTEPSHTLRQRSMAYQALPVGARLALFDEIERVVFPQIARSGLGIDPKGYFPPPEGLAEFRAKRAAQAPGGHVLAPDRQ